VAGHESIETLLTGLDDSSWNVRNACSMALGKVYERKPNDEIIKQLHEELTDTSLAKRLAIIEAIGIMGHDSSLPILLDMLKKSKADLQYAIVMALSSWANIDLLSALIDVGDSKDYLTRRAALMSSYNIIVEAIPNTTLKELMVYFLWIVQIYVETGYLGPLISRILAVPKEDIDMEIFPVALNEYEFTFLNELLDEEDFDRRKYEILHQLAYPLLF
ncbi:MAG: HEAT repeat domain-containing protein, partial [Candidatus Heimdallarchaeota archaeon]